MSTLSLDEINIHQTVSICLQTNFDDECLFCVDGVYFVFTNEYKVHSNKFI